MKNKGEVNMWVGSIKIAESILECAYISDFRCKTGRSQFRNIFLEYDQDKKDLILVGTDGYTLLKIKEALEKDIPFLVGKYVSLLIAPLEVKLLEEALKFPNEKEIKLTFKEDENILILEFLVSKISIHFKAQTSDFRPLNFDGVITREELIDTSVYFNLENLISIYKNLKKIHGKKLKNAFVKLNYIKEQKAPYRVEFTGLEKENKTYIIQPIREKK